MITVYKYLRSVNTKERKRLFKVVKDGQKQRYGSRLSNEEDIWLSLRLHASFLV